MARRVSKKLAQTMAGAELIAHLEQTGVSPVEVMVKSMRRLFKEHQDSLDEADQNNDPRQKSVILARGKDALREACEIAKNVSPYFHARLQSVTVAGDKDKPPVMVELTCVDELRKLVRGGNTAPVQTTQDK
jgi:hypothetical protein